MKIASSAAALAALAALLPHAHAQDAGDLIVRMGVHSVQPASNNSPLVDVASAASLTFSGTYLLTPNWGVELLAALPFEHDIELNGGAKVAETRHLPPTLSLQYHFNPRGNVRPYVGAGVNYTLFFDEKTTGALAGTRLQLDPSFGPAAQLGLDVDFARVWFINADARWIDIDTDAKVNGAAIGKVKIDPYVFGLSLGRRF